MSKLTYDTKFKIVLIYMYITYYATLLAESLGGRMAALSALGTFVYLGFLHCLQVCLDSCLDKGLKRHDCINK